MTFVGRMVKEFVVNLFGGARCPRWLMGGTKSAAPMKSDRFM